MGAAGGIEAVGAGIVGASAGLPGEGGPAESGMPLGARFGEGGDGAGMAGGGAAAGVAA